MVYTAYHHTASIIIVYDSRTLDMIEKKQQDKNHANADTDTNITMM